MAEDHLWWQRGTIYQVYLRSFMDSDGDGVGDLAGITSKLDYLAWLGVDAIWLSPIYPSPMADFGYDVSNYKDIEPTFGTLTDFDALVEEAHRLGLKVILDYVPNHTSDEHPWFVESRSSRDDPKRDWYVWADPVPKNPGGLPNNWGSEFGGSAWEWDEPTEQFYYHAYDKKQPDLNWRNAEVREAMLEVLRFWMDRGVDGFRVDALGHLFEDEQLRDNPPNPEYRKGQPPYLKKTSLHTVGLPEVHEAVAAMRRVFEEYEERVMIVEVYLSVERLIAYYGKDGSGAHLPTNMHLVRADWDAREISAFVESYEIALPPGAWPNWVLSNHDNSRVASRVGDGQTRVAAMFLLTLRGTPTIYQGDEIGMRDGDIPPGMAHDPFEKNSPGHGRDPARTPFQWNASHNAEFTTGSPWLPVPDAAGGINVATQRDEPGSLLALYRRLLSLRRSEAAFSVGSYEEFAATGDVFAYLRECDGRRFLVALNFGSRPRTLDLEDRGHITLSTALDREDEEVAGALSLRGDEGVVVELDR